MKIYQLWIGVIVCLVIFFATATMTLTNTEGIKQNNTSLYFNGYLNFTFNGIAKFFEGEGFSGFNENVAINNSYDGNKEGVVSLKVDKDTLNVKKQFNDAVMNGVNNVLKNSTGKDLDDIERDIKNLPIN